MRLPEFIQHLLKRGSPEDPLYTIWSGYIELALYYIIERVGVLHRF